MDINMNKENKHKAITIIYFNNFKSSAILKHCFYKIENNYLKQYLIIKKYKIINEM